MRGISLHKTTVRYALRALLATSVQTTPLHAAQTEDIGDVLGTRGIISLTTGYPKPLSTAPGVATIITYDDMLAMGATTVDQVLEAFPGVHVSTADAVNSVTTIRGISAGPLVLLNGIPLVQGFLNAYAIKDTFLIDNIQQIEVLRGPASALYGADAAAGVINIVTKSGHDIHGVEGGVRVGSFDTYDGWFRKSSRWNNFDVAVMLNGRTTNGYDRTVNADAQSALDLRFGTRASNAPGPINVNRDVLDARVDVSNRHWTLHAGYLHRFNVGTGIGIARTLDPNGNIESGVLTVDLTRRWFIGTDLDLSAQLAFVGSNTAYDLTLYPAGGIPGGPPGINQSLGIDEYRGRAEFTALYRGFEPSGHTLRFGFGGWHDWFSNTEDVRNYTVRNAQPVLTPTFADRGGINDVPIFRSLNQGTFFTYFQDEWSPRNDLSITLGGRIDHYSQFGTKFTPRASAVWNLTKRFTGKLLYGQAFKAPSTLQTDSNGLSFALGNRSLRPTTVDTTELAFNYEAVPTALQLNFSLFWYTARDIVIQVPAARSPNGSAFTNQGNAEGYGGELESVWRVNDRLRTLVRYSYQDPIDNSEGSSPHLAPRHQLYWQANYQFLPQTFLDINTKTILDRPRPPGDPRPLTADYTVVTLGLRRANVLPGMDAAFYARNLFNADSREPATLATPFDIPNAGREFMGWLSFKF